MAMDDVFEAYMGLLTMELTEELHAVLFRGLRACFTHLAPEHLTMLLGVSASTLELWQDEDREREHTVTFVHGLRLVLLLLMLRVSVLRWLLRTRREGVFALCATCLDVGSWILAQILYEWARARLGTLNRAYVTRLLGGGPRTRVVRRFVDGKVDDMLLRSALRVCLGVSFATLIPAGSPLTRLARELSVSGGSVLPDVVVVRAAFDTVKQQS